MSTGIKKGIGAIGGLLVLYLLVAFFAGWAPFKGTALQLQTNQCPTGMECIPKVPQACPAGMECTPKVSSGTAVVHEPALTGPVWKRCLQRLGILDKCRVVNGDVECRQSVAVQARSCGV